VYLRIARRRSGVVVGRRGINWTGALLRLTGSAGEEAGYGVLKPAGPLQNYVNVLIRLKI